MSGGARVGLGAVVSQSMGAAAASSFASVPRSVVTDWFAQWPSGRCAGSGPGTAASACSSSLVLWVVASLSRLGEQTKREKRLSNKHPAFLTDSQMLHGGRLWVSS